MARTHSVRCSRNVQLCLFLVLVSCLLRFFVSSPPRNLKSYSIYTKFSKFNGFPSTHLLSILQRLVQESSRSRRSDARLCGPNSTLSDMSPIVVNPAVGSYDPGQYLAQTYQKKGTPYLVCVKSRDNCALFRLQVLRQVSRRGPTIAKETRVAPVCMDLPR